jgi:hemolysin III
MTMDVAVATRWDCTAPPQLSEEKANFVTHGAALALSLVGMQPLLAATAGCGSVAQVAGTAVFGASMVLVYLASTIYHAIQDARLKSTFQVIDHATIYLLIAGTYTPFLLALPAPWPTWALAAIWSLAGLGVLFKAVFGPRHERLSMTMYLAIGWIGVLAINPLVERVSCGGVACLLSGGLAYTAGTIFFTRHDVKYAHAIWHMFVVLGSALHYSAVVLYVIPLGFRLS